MLVPYPMIRDLCLLTWADEWNGLAVNECLIVARDQYPTGMQSLATSNLISDLFQQPKLLVTGQQTWINQQNASLGFLAFD
jgi:hypothetical protein